MLGGKFIIEIKRKDGTVETIEFHNVVTKEGKNYLMQAGITGTQSPITSWYVGLIGADVTPTEDDTASTALGSTGTYGEIIGYDETARPAYNGQYSAGQVGNGASPATFTINADTTAYGAFITSTSTKQDNTGILLAAGRFSSAKALSAGDSISITYVISS